MGVAIFRVCFILAVLASSNTSVSNCSGDCNSAKWCRDALRCATTCPTTNAASKSNENRCRMCDDSGCLVATSPSECPSSQLFADECWTWGYDDDVATNSSCDEKTPPDDLEVRMDNHSGTLRALFRWTPSGDKTIRFRITYVRSYANTVALCILVSGAGGSCTISSDLLKANGLMEWRVNRAYEIMVSALPFHSCNDRGPPRITERMIWREDKPAYYWPNPPTPTNLKYVITRRKSAGGIDVNISWTSDGPMDHVKYSIVYFYVQTKPNVYQCRAENARTWCLKSDHLSVDEVYTVRVRSYNADSTRAQDGNGSSPFSDPIRVPHLPFPSSAPVKTSTQSSTSRSLRTSSSYFSRLPSAQPPENPTSSSKSHANVLAVIASVSASSILFLIAVGVAVTCIVKRCRRPRPCSLSETNVQTHPLIPPNEIRHSRRQAVVFVVYSQRDGDLARSARRFVDDLRTQHAIDASSEDHDVGSHDVMRYVTEKFEDAKWIIFVCSKELKALDRQRDCQSVASSDDPVAMAALVLLNSLGWKKKCVPVVMKSSDREHVLKSLQDVRVFVWNEPEEQERLVARIDETSLYYKNPVTRLKMNATERRTHDDEEDDRMNGIV